MPSHAPATSYVVWHTQRTGSSLLCMALDATGVAGHPEEWPEDRLLDTTADAATACQELWTRQTTPNGVLAVKFSYHQPAIDSVFRLFGRTGTGQRADWREAWTALFPDCRHVMMTRRDKFRLAVSWWKAINGGPGHRSHDGSPLPWQGIVPAAPDDLASAYDFRAIRALVLETVQREAGLQALLTELGVAPLTIVYEDFVADYEGTVRTVLAHLGLEAAVSEIPPPRLARTSDALDEQWLQRFLTDLAQRRP